MTRSHIGAGLKRRPRAFEQRVCTRSESGESDMNEKERGGQSGRLKAGAETTPFALAFPSYFYIHYFALIKFVPTFPILYILCFAPIVITTTNVISCFFSCFITILGKKPTLLAVSLTSTP